MKKSMSNKKFEARMAYGAIFGAVFMGFVFGAQLSHAVPGWSGWTMMSHWKPVAMPK
jgi:hypothetical protein